jgi:hypothetical protein
MAEMHLETMNDLLSSPDVATSQKIDLWRSLVEYASLKPPKEAPAGMGNNLTINIAGFAAAPVAGQGPRPVIDVTPQTRVIGVGG